MAVRDGMTELIAELRLMTDTGTTSDEVNEVDYWSDEQLQAILDQYSQRMTKIKLRPVMSFGTNGTTQTRFYNIPDILGRWFERDASDGAFVVQRVDGTPVLVGATDDAYQPNYERREIVFNSDTLRKTFYLSAIAYDLNKAAADIWFKKAGLRASLITWRSDNHTLHEDQEYEHCMRKYIEYSSRGGLTLSRQIRVDEAYDGGNNWRWSALR